MLFRCLFLAQARRRKVFALLINNDTYDLPQLNVKHPVTDVRLLASCFDERTTVKVVENASEAELTAELDGFAAAVRAAAAEAAGGLWPMVFVHWHFSGHGVDSSDDTLMCLRDYDGTLGRVSGRVVIAELAPFASVLATFDCCRQLAHGDVKR